MNKLHLDILRSFIENESITQRDISHQFQCSLGKVNQQISILKEKGYMDNKQRLTKEAKILLEQSKPKNAIILAAGYGFRMVPINHNTNKALIKVKGEVLIERLIKQLHAVNIYDITIVVGYMKEAFEYLIDQYHMTLKVNMEYTCANSLYSLARVKHLLDNTYIIPCDLYFEENPFSTYELYSWFMVTNETDQKSFYKCVGDKLKYVSDHGNRIVGVSYIDQHEKGMLIQRIQDFVEKGNQSLFWEEILIEHKKCILDYKVIDDALVQEFNTFDDLQRFDSMSPTLKTEILDIIQHVLKTSRASIKNIIALKTGMTNRSFLFTCDDKKYIMRIPGEGTDRLINRKQEKAVYDVINELHMSDKVLYFDENKGYKLTNFIDDVRNCDPNKPEEVQACMTFLRTFHSKKLKVPYAFDIYEKIEYYEQLRGTKESTYKDYKLTKEHIYELREFVEQQEKEYTLCHIDSVPDNFLFYQEHGEEKIKLIDWEYASMQDPHVDIAMFAIYALYDKHQVDQTIDFYFSSSCASNTRLKIYCYIASCGLLWSNWCEYKSSLGVEFGEYSLAQYRYAKEYYHIVKEALQEKGRGF